MSLETDLAYCAGVIDSDGCIRIGKRLVKEKGRDKNPYLNYLEMIQVGQVEPQAVLLLKELFGGYIGRRKPKPTGNVKTARLLYVWRVQQLKAQQCLIAILPYLRIKKEHGLNALEFRRVLETSKAENKTVAGFNGTRSRSREFLDAMECLFQKQKHLNRGTPHGEQDVVQEEGRTPG